MEPRPTEGTAVWGIQMGRTLKPDRVTAMMGLEEEDAATPCEEEEMVRVTWSSSDSVTLLRHSFREFNGNMIKVESQTSLQYYEPDRFTRKPVTRIISSHCRIISSQLSVPATRFLKITPM